MNNIERFLFENDSTYGENHLRYHTMDPNKPVHYCHYTNEFFKKERDLFGERVNGLSYDYSDRLRQWDFDKSTRAFDVAKKSGHPARSANYYSAYLSAYFGKQMECLHVLGCFNLATGYEVLVFGYREVVNDGPNA